MGGFNKGALEDFAQSSHSEVEEAKAAGRGLRRAWGEPAERDDTGK